MWMIPEERKKDIAEDREIVSMCAEAFFLSLDTNSDGKLTQSERAAAAAFTEETLPDGLSMAVVNFVGNYDDKSDDVFTLEEWKDYNLYLYEYRLVFGRKQHEGRKYSKPKLKTFNELNPIQNYIDDESIAKFLSDHDYNYIDR